MSLLNFQKGLEKNMNKIKPNSVEAVMFFALYICAQDKKIAKEEKNELILDIQVIRKLYFDIYGEFIDDSYKEVINSININDETIKPFISNNLSQKEKDFVSSMLTDPKIQDIAILAARHAAAADGFHKLEKKKFDYWVKAWDL
tara:strand:+ start:433 stop:864 length:432 start_codon:yes stop_codon:yes gene_type:complete